MPFFVKRSFVGKGVSSLSLKAGQHFTIHLKGVGWTQLDNTIAVDYDNSYVGYGCGFNSNGDVVMNMVATGEPGTHLIDMYPLLYTQQPSYANTPYGMVPVLTYARDAPGLALGLPAAGDAAGDHDRQVGWSRGEGGALGAPPSRLLGERRRLHAREARRPLGQPPVPAAEDRHQRRDEDRPHERRVDQDGERERRAPNCCSRLDAAGDEARERGDHDRRRGRDDRGRCARGRARRRARCRASRSHDSRMRVTRKTS